MYQIRILQMQKQKMGKHYWVFIQLGNHLLTGVCNRKKRLIEGGKVKVLGTQLVKQKSLFISYSIYVMLQRLQKTADSLLNGRKGISPSVDRFLEEHGNEPIR
jgi:hypothetical protein